MHNLTAPGQIQKGATVVLAFKNKGQAHTVVDVLMAGTDREEILLCRKRNLYFITSMAVDGSSWAKEVKYFNKSDYLKALGPAANNRNCVDCGRFVGKDRVAAQSDSARYPICHTCESTYEDATCM